MIKLNHFQPESVILVFPEPEVQAKPALINGGRCWMWAYIAYETFADTELWDVNSHAFIRYRDKFYDCERLKGEDDWRDLPANDHKNFYFEPPKQFTVEVFKKRWHPQTDRFKVCWTQLDRKVLELIGHHKAQHERRNNEELVTQQVGL
jgi:hypothetical protein